jgi:hypothetical protein
MSPPSFIDFPALHEQFCANGLNSFHMSSDDVIDKKLMGISGIMP